MSVVDYVNTDPTRERGTGDDHVIQDQHTVTHPSIANRHDCTELQYLDTVTCNRLVFFPALEASHALWIESPSPRPSHRSMAEA